MTAQTYHGSCQCGAVSFDVTMDISRPITCDCSRCRRLGSVLAFTPRANFKLHSGEDNLTEYLFNKHAIHHLFCRTCGIESFAYGTMPDGTPMAAVNLNCLDGVDARALPAHHHHGAAA